ncbi:Multidrug resistance protein MdtA [Pandoraea pneumonica]|uniref:Multidrug resistance protein MdtA n=1 Tax=Pandoraea pneumonica TaxID=2508299 RepID=A0A5E4TSX7_9BURK|nr:efflux RND transporter periplasmic adaptor subunit [Pandoraea pneumonica]VVD90283.1 Multidrug resistance protein MdtA [Pandoraea pneumonica]
MTHTTAQDSAAAAPPPGPHRRSRHWRWLVLVLLAIVALLVWRWIANRKPPPAPPPPPVAVITAIASARDLPRYVLGIGTVQATTSVTVRVRVDGQIERIAFQEGQDVKAGDLLVQIDPRPYRAQLEQARATKARDQAQLVNARVDLKRYQTLAAQGASPQQQADTQAALVKQLEAAVMTDQAQIDYAAVQLDYTTIRSPVTGRTGVRLVDVGNIVHAADANGIVIVNQIDPITVLFTLPEEAVGRVNAAMQAAGSQGLAVDVFPRTGTEQLASGKLTLINNQIDNTSGTVQLKATFANADHRLWPGQYVNARLTLGVMAQAIALDNSVIQSGPNGTYVYVVGSDGRAAVQPVKVGITQGNRTIIESGLAPGARVVVEGQLKLRPGVAVVEARGAAGGATGGAGSGASASAATSAAPATPASGTPAAK